MNFLKRERTIISIFTMLSLVITPVLQAYTTAFTDHVANTYLSTFKVIDAKEVTIAKEKALNQQTIMDHIRQILATRNLGLAQLGPRDMVEIEFKNAQKSPEQGAVIDTNFIDKLEVIKNLNESNIQDHLIYRLTTSSTGDSYLQTIMGYKRMAEMITQPLTDLSLIQKRQHIIQELVTNDALRNECSAILKKMHHAEPLFYDLHTIKELKDLEKALYFSPVLGKLGFDRPVPLSVTTRIGQIGGCIFGLSAPLTIAATIIKREAIVETMRDVGNGNADPEACGKLAGGLYFGILSPLVSILALSVMKQQANAMLNMQERLIGASTYFTGIRKLIYNFGTNQKIRQLMPELVQISQELHHASNKSSNFNDLNNLLAKSTFDDGKPSVFSSVGNILVAYKQFMKESVRLEYADAKNLLGELDVYVALAQKIKEHETTNAQFCFVQFEQNADKPILQAINFWNPFIESNKIVCNTISLNTGNERNIILTGPNTGGKSTLMKAAMIDALLAQTFGIAAAQSMIMTLFTKLTSYLNISDDTASGISLFKAEVKRAQELMEMLRSLPSDQFAFVIIDEIFTGTAPEKAEDLSYKFMKQISEFKNCIFIDATHFKKLVELEQETQGVCKNYHTGVIIDPANPGKVAKYTYKLTPGPSPINNAQQVAEEAGIFSF